MPKRSLREIESPDGPSWSFSALDDETTAAIATEAPEDERTDDPASRSPPRSNVRRKNLRFLDTNEYVRGPSGAAAHEGESASKLDFLNVGTSNAPARPKSSDGRAHGRAAPYNAEERARREEEYGLDLATLRHDTKFQVAHSKHRRLLGSHWAERKAKMQAELDAIPQRQKDLERAIRDLEERQAEYDEENGADIKDGEEAEEKIEKYNKYLNMETDELEI